MKNKKLRFLILVAVIVFHNNLNGQSLSINQIGDTILTFDDGSWRYFKDGDTVFQVEVLGPLVEKERKKLRRLKANQTEIEKKINKYYDDQRAEQDRLNADAEKLDDLMGILVNQIQTEEKKTESYASLQDQIKSLNKQQKQVSKRIKKQNKIVDKALQLKRAKLSFQAKWLAKHEKKNGPIEIDDYSEPSKPLESEPVITKKEKKKTKPDRVSTSKSSKQLVKKYHPLPVHKPSYDYNDCEIAFLGTDEFSNKRRIDVAKRTLFEYTHEELKPYFKDKVYMLCEGFLSAQPGFKYLTLEFTIASDRAKQSFGALQKGSILTIKLIDDTFINLINKSDDYGTVNFQNKTTRFSGQYVIDKKQERDLLETEIDQVRVSWTSGYEDYNIYELDFFKKQFECLNNAY